MERGYIAGVSLHSRLELGHTPQPPTMSPSAPRSRPALTHEAVLEELQSVCASSSFARAGEARRLLCYLVETEQAGMAADLREVQIASALYGREPSYDPKLDGIVRVNAARLRVRLEDHYLRHPSALRIILPVGSYVPCYEQSASAQQAVHSEQSVDARKQGDLRVASTEAISGGWPDADASPVPPFRQHGRPLWVAAAVMTVLLVFWMVFRPGAGAATAGPAWMAHPFSRMGGVEHFPAFSPDGRSLIFVWDRAAGVPAAIYIQKLNSEQPQAVTTGASGETRPAWSPDGGTLAFVRLQALGQKQIILRSMPGGAERVVATLHGRVPWLCNNPKISWAPDGGTLYTSGAPSAVIGTHGEEERCAILSVRLADGAVQAFTRSPAGSLGDLEASVSPDGQTVAFVRSQSYAVDDVYTVGVHDGTVRRLTSNDREVQGLAWMGQGSALIISARATDGMLRLTERDIATGQTRPLTDGSGPASFPAIARNGREIAFISYRHPTRLFRASATGERAISVEGDSNSAPRLSPDGRRLAFASDRSGFAEIWVTDADGGNGLRLTHSDGTGAQDPSWFPDGRSILFECRERRQSQLCVISADGKEEVRRLTSEDADHILPSVSRDGRSVYYLSNRSGRQEAYRQSLGGGEPRQISQGGAVGISESWDGQSLYVESFKDGVGFLRIPAGHESVDTASVTERNRNYLLPALQKVRSCPWIAGPAGLIFYSRAVNPTHLMYFDQVRGISLPFAPIQSDDEPNLLSVAPDGRSVLYSTLGRLSGEIDLLEPPMLGRGGTGR